MSYGGETAGDPAAQTFCFEMAQYTQKTRRICGGDAYQIPTEVTLEQLIQAGIEFGWLACWPAMEPWAHHLACFDESPRVRIQRNRNL